MKEFFHLSLFVSGWNQHQQRSRKSCRKFERSVDVSSSILTIWSKQQHDENLRQVLSCIAKAGMKLNRKAAINVQDLSFLKHRLSVEGLVHLSSKVKTVIDVEPPSEPSYSRHFLDSWSITASSSRTAQLSWSHFFKKESVLPGHARL